MQDKDAEIKPFPVPLELYLIIQVTYFQVKLEAKASKNILSNVMFVFKYMYWKWQRGNKKS